MHLIHAWTGRKEFALAVVLLLVEVVVGASASDVFIAAVMFDSDGAALALLSPVREDSVVIDDASTEAEEAVAFDASRESVQAGLASPSFIAEASRLVDCSAKSVAYSMYKNFSHRRSFRRRLRCL
jgi:hypothetical protein